ncbi:MAG: DivIVA domain-containing protein, partial [Acidimicrobiales bacterium]
MPLSPDDIEHKRFAVGLRGYDKSEVDDFLDDVAAEVRQLTHRVASLQLAVDADHRAAATGGW